MSRWRSRIAAITTTWLPCSSSKDYVFVSAVDSATPQGMTQSRFDPVLDAEIRAFSRQLLKKTSKTAVDGSKDGGSGVCQYGNYASKCCRLSGSFANLTRNFCQSIAVLTTIDSGVEANDIFGANVKRLEELKHKYDPDNLFSHGTRLTPRPLVVVN